MIKKIKEGVKNPQKVSLIKSILSMLWTMRNFISAYIFNMF